MCWEEVAGALTRLVRGRRRTGVAKVQLAFHNALSVPRAIYMVNSVQ